MKYKYVIAFIILNILDISLAFALVSKWNSMESGLVFEAMPIMAGLLSIGLVPAMTTKVIVSSGVAITLYKSRFSRLLRVLVIALAVICIYQIGLLVVL